jgi:cell division transport system permease protein
MFILPLLAMLIGIEFVIIFNRVTNAYEEKLKSSYSILVSSKRELTTPFLQKIDPQIESVEAMDKTSIARDVTVNIQDNTVQRILKELPTFYRVHLKSYLSVEDLNKTANKIRNIKGVLNVDIFGESYSVRHDMFSLIKNSLNIFIAILSVVSLLLVMKQMEVWQLAHKKRMQIMEIFGAPLMLRIGVIFKMALIDALIATVINTALFIYLQAKWSQVSGLRFIKDNSHLLFKISDIFVWILAALIIVIISVFYVALRSSQGYEE